MKWRRESLLPCGRPPTPNRPLSNSKRVVTQLDSWLIRQCFYTALTTRAPTEEPKPTARSRLVDLGARSEEGDHEERHYSDQNVDNAAHHDPANSSYRCPFRR